MANNKKQSRLKKDYPIFDCDAHVNDPLQVWEYVDPQYRDLVRQSYWRDNTQAILNGKLRVLGGGEARSNTYNPICIAGPKMNKKLLRRLQQMPLNAEQVDYLEHKGAYNPHARLKEMDAMGIDQVLVIPTMLTEHYLRIESAEGAYGLARAYNNWVTDYCKAVPDRLFPAGLAPVQNAAFAAEEIRRIHKLGFPVVLVRPVDAQRNYPNRIAGGFGAIGGGTWDLVYRTIQETGITLGMHTFPAPAGGVGMEALAYSPGELLTKSETNSQTLSFVFEAMTWASQVLLSGFLDRYPQLKMIIFESNATWLPELLERCDRLFKLYANERALPAKRLPTEAFFQQCMISFESDETPVFRQWDFYQNIGIWASDAYHHDGADAWSGIREMEKAEVPAHVQAKLMGANARRFYGIQGKLFVTGELDVPRPAWFPKQDEEFNKWWQQEAHPRKHRAATSPSPRAGESRAY